MLPGLEGRFVRVLAFEGFRRCGGMISALDKFRESAGVMALKT